MKTKSLFKKCTVIFILFLGMIGMTNLNAQETFTVGDLNYQINDDGISVTVIGHVDGSLATGELNIPEIVIYNGDNYAVTEIGNYAFDGCSGFTGSLIIPNSVTTIWHGAFRYCSGFSGLLTIPNSVTYIGFNAFESCSNFMGSLTIPDSVTAIGDFAFCNCNGFTGSLTIGTSVGYIGYQAFYNCYGFTGSLNIPNSVTSIGRSAFSVCYGFNELILPNTIITIGSYAFNRCFGLNGSLIIPNSVTTIEDYAFGGCSGFTGSLVIPSSVTQIGDNPFWGCSGFESVEVDPYNPVYDSRINCNAIIERGTNRLVCGFRVTTLPNTVTNIGKYAFSGYSTLYHIDIPNNVYAIEDNAFQNCGLIDAFIPSSVDSIGLNPFLNCVLLEEIIVDSENTVFDSRNSCNAIIRTLDNELLSGCKNTIIPNDITSIGDNAFYGVEMEGTLIIPNSVIYIGEQSFSNCTGFDSSLIIGNSVSEIGNYAFANCHCFTEVISLAINPPLIDNTTFYNFGCDTITVPCGCISAYHNTNWYNSSGWFGFSTIIEDCSDVSELDDNHASVYPNPTNGIVKIEAENIQMVSVFDMSGAVVFESSASGDEFEYDFSNNESGGYLVRIGTSQSIFSKRITVM